MKGFIEKHPIYREIINRLVKGMTELEIAKELKDTGFTPSSISSVDKKMKLLRKAYKSRTSVELIVRLIQLKEIEI